MFRKNLTPMSKSFHQRNYFVKNPLSDKYAGKVGAAYAAMIADTKQTIEK